jgi:CO/xanthine dehydrogenase Mo-binding subunit
LIAEQAAIAHEHGAFPLIDGVPRDVPLPPLSAPDDTVLVHASYTRPYLMHASLAPSAAMARWENEGRLTVWSHSQGIELLRPALAKVLRIDVDRVTVVHSGAGIRTQRGRRRAGCCAVRAAGARGRCEADARAGTSMGTYGPACASIWRRASMSMASGRGRTTSESTHAGRPSHDGLN